MRNLLTGLCAALLASASVPAFANTTTTHYSLNMPSVGADSNNWGNLTNANWSSLDSLIYGIQITANAACPVAGCTFTGGVTLTPYSGVSGASGAWRAFSFETSGTTVWNLLATNTAQSGTCTGSDFQVEALDNSGNFLSNPITVTRCTGAVAMTGNLSVGGSTTVTGSLDAVNNLVVGGAAIFGNGYGGNNFAAYLNGSTPVFALTSSLSIQANSGVLNLWNGSYNASFGSNGVLGVPGLSVSGTVSFPAGSISGTALASGAVTNAAHANMASGTIKGNNGPSAASPSDLTTSQVVSMLGLASGGGATYGGMTIPTNNGNIIVNWGTETGVSSNTDASYASFVTGCASQGIVVTSSGATISSLSTSGVIVHNAMNSTQTIYWVAICK